MTNWHLITDKSGDEYKVEIIYTTGFRRAIIRWDGCIHYYKYYNQPFSVGNHENEMVDYIHICNIDYEIKLLQELKNFATEYFSEWPG